MKHEKLEILIQEAKKFKKVGGQGLEFVDSRYSEEDDRIHFRFKFTGKLVDSSAYRKTGKQAELLNLFIDLNARLNTSIDDFRKNLLRILRQAWIHEFEELITYDDKPVYDAHPDGSGALLPGKIIAEPLKPNGKEYVAKVKWGNVKWGKRNVNTRGRKDLVL